MLKPIPEPFLFPFVVKNLLNIFRFSNIVLGDLNINIRTINCNYIEQNFKVMTLHHGTYFSNKNNTSENKNLPSLDWICVRNSIFLKNKFSFEINKIN